MNPDLRKVAADGSPVTQPSPSPLLARVRTVLNGLDLDCECRDKLDAALERFVALENRRQLRGLILDARHQAERIAALLELVSELDTVSTDEADLSVFQEIALLFDDIKGAAERGAEDMVSARELGLRPGEAA